MTFRQLVLISILTTTYLCFEFAFNARLLDVVGGAASNEQLHHIERYGRSLSGAAVALVILQVMLGKRARSVYGSPHELLIFFWCLVGAGLVYVSLQVLVDQLVERSSPELRRASLNIILVQRALVNGAVQLDGLDDDPKLFARPEGKAFLALFPVMAVSVERLDEKIRDAKLELISRQVVAVHGGAAGYYQRYREVVQHTHEQWQRYAKSRRGTVVQGLSVPPGLSWAQFFAHRGVQAEMRERMHLPANVTLKPSYKNGVEFDREVFSPLVKDTARNELVRYEAPAHTFADNGSNAIAGRDAVRAVIVPPVALFFSLMGAVGHLAKLCYLLLSLLVVAHPALRAAARYLWLVPVAVLVLIWTLLGRLDNAVTQSRLYAYMRQQLLMTASDRQGELLRAQAMAKALHVVAVGQGLSYPFNELVRTTLLGGVTFGYEKPRR